MRRLPQRLVTCVTLAAFLVANAAGFAHALKAVACPCTDCAVSIPLKPDAQPPSSCKHCRAKLKPEAPCLNAKECRASLPSPSKDSGPADPACPSCPGCAYCSVAKVPCVHMAPLAAGASAFLGYRVTEASSPYSSPISDRLTPPPRT